MEGEKKNDGSAFDDHNNRHRQGTNDIGQASSVTRANEDNTPRRYRSGVSPIKKLASLLSSPLFPKEKGKEEAHEEPQSVNDAGIDHSHSAMIAACNDDCEDENRVGVVGEASHYDAASGDHCQTQLEQDSSRINEDKYDYPCKHRADENEGAVIASKKKKQELGDNDSLTLLPLDSSIYEERLCQAVSWTEDLQELTSRIEDARVRPKFSCHPWLILCELPTRRVVLTLQLSFHRSKMRLLLTLSTKREPFKNLSSTSKNSRGFQWVETTIQILPLWDERVEIFKRDVELQSSMSSPAWMALQVDEGKISRLEH
jgi:hypothetical protein